MRKLSEPPFEDFDEHDSPTEPMSAIILSPYAVPSSLPVGGNGLEPYGAFTIPAPRPPEVPFPCNGQPVAPYTSLPEMSGVYPVLPASPLRHGNGRPPGGAGFVGEKGRPLRAQTRHSSIPTVVGALFVAAQLILLVRVVLLLFGVSASNVLVELMYAGGTLLAWPLRLLIEHLHLPAQIGADLIGYLAALIAILVYGVLARVLVRFLKALLNSR
ncbi:MAG TPA: hypothetical protein VIZ18_17025 [Ktedonobacteraceae bacterium]